MIYTGSIAFRLQTLVQSDPVLISSGFTKVDLGMPIYPDAAEAPYVTIQVGPSEINPYLLQANVGSNVWRGSVEFYLYHRELDVDCGANSYQRIMAFQDRLTDMVNSNVQLDGLVQKLRTVKAELYQYSPTQSGFDYTNRITLIYEVQA
jgi:hypothetical protein